MDPRGAVIRPSVRSRVRTAGRTVPAGRGPGPRTSRTGRVSPAPRRVSRGLTEEQREETEDLGREAIDFARFSPALFEDVVLGNPDYVDLIKNEAFVHRTYYMGTVDDRNHVNFYDGMIRVVGPDGDEHARYHPRDYRDHVVEHVEPWTHLKVPESDDDGLHAPCSATTGSAGPWRIDCDGAWRTKRESPSTSAVEGG